LVVEAIGPRVVQKASLHRLVTVVAEIGWGQNQVEIEWIMMARIRL
jgi:hypothetical protein